jgi:hypothetical protein
MDQMVTKAIEEVESEQVWSDSVSVKSGPRETLRKGKKFVKTIQVTPRMGKMVAKTMQVTKVREVTWVHCKKESVCAGVLSIFIW